MGDKTQKTSNSAPDTSSGKWRTPLTIVLLIFFPLAGIILMWVITQWSKAAKWIITSIYVVLIILTIILIPVVVNMSNKIADQRGNDNQAKMDLDQSQSAVSQYKDKRGKYPVAKSYQSMKDVLSKVYYNVDQLPESSGYIFKYCSSNGSDYKLEIEKLKVEPSPYTLGTDSCQSEP